MILFEISRNRDRDSLAAHEWSVKQCCLRILPWSSVYPELVTQLLLFKIWTLITNAFSLIQFFYQFPHLSSFPYTLADLINNLLLNLHVFSSSFCLTVEYFNEVCLSCLNVWTFSSVIYFPQLNYDIHCCQMWMKKGRVSHSDLKNATHFLKCTTRTSAFNEKVSYGLSVRRDHFSSVF